MQENALRHLSNHKHEIDRPEISVRSLARAIRHTMSLKHLILVFVTYVFSFSPILRFGNATLNITLPLTPILVIMFLARPSIPSQSRGVFATIMTLLSALIAQSLLHAFQLDWADTTGLRWSVYSVAALLKVAILCQLEPTLVGDSCKLLRIAAQAAIANTAIVVAQIILPELTDVIDRRILILSDDVDLRSLDRIRPRGLSSFGGASLSAYLATLLSLLWITIFSSNTPPRLSDYFTSVILFVGVLASGRTGLLIILLGGVFVVISALRLASVRRFASLGALLASLVAVTTLGISALTLSSTETIEAGLNRTFEYIVRYESEGEVRVSSLDGVIEQFEAARDLPGDLTSILFGTGNYGRVVENQYLASDSGFLRLTFGSGIIGLAVWLFVSLAPPLKALGPIRQLRWGPAFLILTCIAINIKEPFILASPGFGLLLAAYLLEPYSRYRETMVGDARRTPTVR